MSLQRYLRSRYMRKYFTISILFCLALELNAQLDPPSWYYVVDGFNDTDFSDLEVDQQGNTYATVNHQGDLSLTGNNGRLIPHAPHMGGVLIKLSPQGKLIWARGFQSAFDNRINDLCLGPDGSIYITGFGDGEMHFPGKEKDLIFGKAKGKDEFHQPQAIYLAKYSPEGEPIWVNYWSTAWGEGLSVAVNSKSEIAWSYYHNNELKVGEKIIDDYKYTTGSKSNVSRAYFSPDGQLQKIVRVQVVDSGEGSRGPKLRYDIHDNLYCFGRFNMSMKLSEKDSLVNNGFYDSLDAYLVKYSPTGEFLWAKHFGGENVQLLTDIDIAPDGSVYGSGEYRYECILMDGIRVAEQSRYEYRSGSNTFYFHLFEDGEPDFIRFFEGKMYNGYFTANSIDYDVNGDTHMVGSFTDTLEVDGFSLQTPKDYSTPFLGNLHGKELIELKSMAKIKSSWICPWRIRSHGSAYATGFIYYGNDIRVNVNDNDVLIKNHEYGRGTLIVGGSIRVKHHDTGVLAEQRASSRLERLESIEPLLICSNPELADASTTWFPIPDDDLTHVQSPDDQNSGVNLTPCGMTLDDVEALLFPNPTNGPVSLKLKGMLEANVQIDVLSEKGQLLFSKYIQIPSSDFTMELDMSAAAAGTYFVRITYANFEKALRLVKVSK